jgi:rhodanese-related sulfurtransferase
MNTVNYIVVGLLFLSLASCTGIYENGAEMAADSKAGVHQIEIGDLQTKIENGGDYYLIDVRQPADYYASSIPGSVLIPRGVLEFKIADTGFWSEQYIYPPEKESEIIVYSSNGDLGILAAKSLMQLGYTKVYNLEGGYKAFNSTQDPGAVAVNPGAGCGN